MAVLNPVSILPTQDAQVDLNPVNDAGVAATVSDVSVVSSDPNVLSDGRIDAGGPLRFRCVSGSVGSAMLTISGTNTAGTVLTDTVVVTVAAAPVVATQLGTVVTAIAK